MRCSGGDKDHRVIKLPHEHAATLTPFHAVVHRTHSEETNDRQRIASNDEPVRNAGREDDQDRCQRERTRKGQEMKQTPKGWRAAFQCPKLGCSEWGGGIDHLAILVGVNTASI